MGSEVRRGVHEATKEVRGRIRETLEIDRPKIRGDCLPCPICQAVRDGALKKRSCGHSVDEMLRRTRPCVWAGCRHHLYLDVTSIGSIKFAYPDIEPDELEASCSLDIADGGALTLEEMGERIQVTRERARQLEVRALLSLRNAGGRLRG
jgi:hypothetical protein